MDCLWLTKLTEHPKKSVFDIKWVDHTKIVIPKGVAAAHGILEGHYTINIVFKGVKYPSKTHKRGFSNNVYMVLPVSLSQQIEEVYNDRLILSLKDLTLTIL